MNHHFCSIWNRALGAWVAAPETASSNGGASQSVTAPGCVMRTEPPRMTVLAKGIYTVLHAIAEIRNKKSLLNYFNNRLNKSTSIFFASSIILCSNLSAEILVVDDNTTNNGSADMYSPTSSSQNKVSAVGLNKPAAQIYGGIGVVTSGNELIIKNSTIRFAISGDGSSLPGSSATNNNLYITDSQMYSASGGDHAMLMSGNRVEIYNSDMNYAQGAEAPVLVGAQAINNHIYVQGSRIGTLAGGQGYALARGNTVVAKDTSGNWLIGGKATIADDNKITIINSTYNNVYGGETPRSSIGITSAKNNTVEIIGTSAVNNVLYGGVLTVTGNAAVINTYDHDLVTGNKLIISPTTQSIRVGGTLANFSFIEFDYSNFVLGVGEQGGNEPFAALSVGNEARLLPGGFLTNFTLKGINKSSGRINLIEVDASGLPLDLGGTIISDLAVHEIYDYISLSPGLDKNNHRLYLDFGLNWFAANNNSHGTFTIGDGNSFSISEVLDNRQPNNNPNSNYNNWNGRTLTKNGLGTLILKAQNTYTGGTIINAGTLVAAHNKALGIGDVTVGSATGAAALEVAADTQLDIVGNLTFKPGSTYRVYAPNNTPSSRINVTGTAALAGRVLHVSNELNNATDFRFIKTYTILSAAGGLTGTFDEVGSTFAYLNTALGYTDTDVTLTIARKDAIRFADLAKTSNQSAAADGIESLPFNNPLYRFVETLPEGAPPAVFNSLSGDSHANVAGSLAGLAAFAPSISQNRLRSNMTAGMYSGAPIAQSAGALPASAFPSSKALPAWAEVVGHWQSYDGNGNAAQLKQRTRGLFLGMDQEVASSGWRLGGSVGFTQAEGKVSARDAESDVHSYSAAIYGGKSFGTGTGPRINVLGGVAYSWHDIETNRKLPFLNQTLKADYSASTTQVFAEVGYALGQYDKFGIEPFAGLNLGKLRTGSFQESGGFAALRGAKSTDDLATTTLGLRMHGDFELAGMDARVRATVGWRHALGDLAANKTMAFEGGQNFTVAGAPLARNTALVGIETDVSLSRRASLVLGYQGELGSGQRDHAANIKLRWAF